MPSYKIEYHRVWVRHVEAESREQARRVAEEEMSEDSDAEDYNYSVVKKQREVKGGKGAKTTTL